MSRSPRIAPFSSFPPLAIAPGEKIFVLTGAGISAESGVKTFRDTGGLWENERIEDVATPEGWTRDPARVWRFYSERRKQLGEVAPNAAHRALAKLESVAELFLVTQNVDDLHERAGSKKVWHMHGELLSSRCEACARPAFRDEELYWKLDQIPACACGARVRPDIVWFGEVPFHGDEIAAALLACDTFVTVGSSGAVYPAAGYVAELRRLRRERPARAIYLGPEVPENAGAFDECRLGKAGVALPELFKPR